MNLSIASARHSSQLEVKKSDRIIAVNGSSGSGQELMKIIAARPIRVLWVIRPSAKRLSNLSGVGVSIIR